MNNGKTNFEGLRVLVIDDDPLVRETIRNVLKTNNIKVIEACDGHEGVAAFTRSPVPLVITDILMPGKEGIETIAELRRLAPELKIIAMSSGGATGNMTFLNIAAKAGAAKTLAKPFKPRELLETISAIL